MEAIKNYLESMFRNLPNTREVLRAKDELGQMMEDKYTELKAEGKTENEAIGTVIAEFGNLDELAMDLGIQSFVYQNAQSVQRRNVTIQEVQEYLRDAGKHAFRIALGVLFCIISPCSYIMADAFASGSKLGEVLAGIFFFGVIAAAVGLFIYSGVVNKKWEFLGHVPCSMDIGTVQYVENEKARYRTTHAMLMTIGVILCVCCVIPGIFADALARYNDVFENMAGACCIIFIALGVFLIVITNMREDSYNKLLKLNGYNTVGGNYTQNREPEYTSNTTAAILSVYWPTITCIYLCWSFLTFQWWISWLVWPIAGIVYAVLKAAWTKKD